MSITIGGYSFNGPYSSTGSLEDRSGVYAILDKRSDSYYLLDVGESAMVKSRVEGHDRKNCWQRNSKGTITCAVKYTPGLQQVGRMQIEQDIRSKINNIPCGKR